MSEKVVKFLVALGTVLTAAGELFKQYNQSRKYVELEKELIELKNKKDDNVKEN